VASAANSNSNSSSSRTTTSSGTNVSGYGVLLAHPSLSVHSSLNNNGNSAEAGGSGPPVAGRRILSPAQMAILAEEDEGLSVQPRASSQLPSPPHSPKSSLDVEGDAQVLVATRVPISPRSSSGLSPLADVSGVSPLSALAAGYKPDEKAEKRKSWLPRFSWLMPSSSSRRGSRDLEAAEGERELLFDAGPSSAGHSPHASMSMPAPPRLVPQSGAGEGMSEFGRRPLLPFLAAAASRPVSGVSAGGRSSGGKSGKSSGGESGGTVFHDAVSTQNSRTVSTQNSFARNGNGNNAQPPMPEPESAGTAEAADAAPIDPLDAPAPAPLSTFASFASASSSSLANTYAGTGGGTSTHSHTLASSSNTTLPPGARAPHKPEPAYPHAPPGLGHDLGWDALSLERGFAQPRSVGSVGVDALASSFAPAKAKGVFGVPVLPPGAAFGLPPGAFGVPFGGGGAAVVGAPMLGPVTVSGPFLDDAPPGAREGWRRLNRSGSFSGTHSYGDFGDVSDVGRRGTFGGLGVGGVSFFLAFLFSFFFFRFPSF
jgi:hypothetical protein